MKNQNKMLRHTIPSVYDTAVTYFVISPEGFSFIARASDRQTDKQTDK